MDALLKALYDIAIAFIGGFAGLLSAIAAAQYLDKISKSKLQSNIIMKLEIELKDAIATLDSLEPETLYPQPYSQIYWRSIISSGGIIDADTDCGMKVANACYEIEQANAIEHDLFVCYLSGATDSKRRIMNEELIRLRLRLRERIEEGISALGEMKENA